MTDRKVGAVAESDLGLSISDYTGLLDERRMKRDLCFAPKVFFLQEVLSHADSLRRIFEEHGVLAAILFGSLTRGTGEGGDLDLAVTSDGQTLEDRSALYDAICRLFHADNVDVILLGGAPFLLRRAIYDMIAGRLSDFDEFGRHVLGFSRAGRGGSPLICETSSSQDLSGRRRGYA